MRRVFSFLRGAILLFFSILALVACENDDDYFSSPSWLGEPIYQTLDEMGTFKNYLTCVEKSGYASVLKGSGYFTVFAPDDEAFSQFLSDNGFGSIDEISESLAKDIVSYSLAVVPASKDTIDDYRGDVGDEIIPDIAFKRQSYYTRGVYEKKVWVKENNAWVEKDYNLVDVNSVRDIPGSGWTYYYDLHNRKHIPFFTDAFMATEGIAEADYNYLYPNVELSDFNVAGANVIQRDIWGANGIIHVVDKVILPLDNLDQCLEKAEECQVFYNILERYMADYQDASDELELTYEQSTGLSRDIYIKGYSPLVFSLNCENFLYGSGASQAEQMDAYKDGFTLFAPTDDAVNQFFSEKFFKFGYNNLDEMPSFVISEFVNAHLFRTTVWPTKFDKTQNYYGETARFNAGSAPGVGGDVVRAQMGSNGIFYVVNKVQATNAFETVLGDILLNPNYTMMYQAMSDVAPELEGLLKNIGNTLVLFLVSNDQFTEAGFNYNAASGSWEFTDDPNRPELGSSASQALQRFVNLHLILVSNAMIEDGFNVENSSGVVLTYGEEYLKYDHGVIYASGNPVSKRPSIENVVESGAVNGQSYELTSPILFSTGNLGDLLRVSSFSNVNNRATKLLAYLEKAAKATYVNDDGVSTSISGTAYDVDDKTIKDITNTNVITMFLPNDPAMDVAVSDGVLLPIASFAPNGDPNVIGEHNQIIERFAKYHIIRGNVPVGENAGGNYATYLKKEDGTFATITINAVKGSPGTLTVTDWKGRTANVNVSSTSTFNILGNRCIVHVIDNYLDYRVQE